eukprot:196445-Rhodomonas_salina.4
MRHSGQTHRHTDTQTHTDTDTDTDTDTHREGGGVCGEEEEGVGRDRVLWREGGGWYGGRVSEQLGVWY